MVEPGTVLKKKRRAPKPGTGYALLRILGLLLMGAGLLTLLGSLIGFIVLLVRLGPDLVSSLGYAGGSQFAGFYLFLMLSWFLLPVFCGSIGFFLAASGFVLWLLGTLRNEMPPAG